jgi:hypothetical protein
LSAIIGKKLLLLDRTPEIREDEENRRKVCRKWKGMRVVRKKNKHRVEERKRNKKVFEVQV